MTAEDAPLVTRPVAPRPGAYDGTLLTVAFAVAMYGPLILIGCVSFVVVYFGDTPVGEPAPDAKANPVAALPHVVISLLAWAVPLSYLAGGVFSVAVLRRVVGPGWAREVGLRRLPLLHLGLALLALPAFMILSDGLAVVVYRLFGMEQQLDHAGQLGELFAGFHPSFVVLAIGVGPGVVEELWCRGFLARGFVGRYGWIGGVGLTSLFFGLLHLLPPYVVVTAAMGACLHFLYACSRSLWVPICVHAANNGFAGLAAVGAVSVGGLERAMAANPAGMYALAAVVLVSCGWAVWSARAVSAGPLGVIVPAAGVRDRAPRVVPTVLALVIGAGLLGLILSG